MIRIRMPHYTEFGRECEKKSRLTQLLIAPWSAGSESLKIYGHRNMMSIYCCGCCNRSFSSAGESVLIPTDEIDLRIFLALDDTVPDNNIVLHLVKHTKKSQHINYEKSQGKQYAILAGVEAKVPSQSSKVSSSAGHTAMRSN
jgi:hypothetical protein